MVVFTSGSTGSPKGVMLPHRAISYRAEVVAREVYIKTFHLTRDDTFLSFLPMSTVANVSTEFSIICLGHKIDIVPGEYGMDMAKIIQYGLERKVSFSFMPPVLAPLFVKHFEGKMRILATGSEQVKNIYNDKFIMINVYGISETAALAAFFVIDRNYENTPIGKLTEGTNGYILDSGGKLVSDGSEGELCISGECVALGYLNRPELTAEKFTSNPFSDDPDHSVLYHTGDLARLLPDGNYEYIQRADWMLKIRGHRVEPGEIENAIRSVAPVTKAVVVGFASRGTETSQTRLYACYTAQDTLDPLKIQEELYKILPDYMVPSYIEQVASLPLNMNNKVDRTKIIPPEIEYFKSDYEKPANDMEKSICESFRELLNLPRVGALDNFILLGGDSVTAAKLSFILYGSTGLSVVDILLHQTPRALAALVNSRQKEQTSGESGSNVKEIDIATALELSPYQTMFYNEWLLDPERYDYNIVEDKILEGEVSPQRLDDSLKRLFSDYFIFLSNVSDNNNTLCWKTREPHSSETKLLQYFDHPIDDKELFSILTKPFDLKNDLLYRFILIKLHDRKYRYITCVHHIITDGTKANAIYEEYANYYNKPDYSGSVNLKQQQMLFAGYLTKIKTILDENRQSICNFWRDYCRDAEPVDLKFLCGSNERNERKTLSPVGICRFSIDQKDTDKVKVVSQKHGITPYIYAQIIFALSLYRMSGQKMISFSYPSAIPEGLALMFGSQLNTMIIKFFFDQNTTAHDLVKQARDFYINVEKNKAIYLPISETLKFLPDRKILDVNFSQSGLRDSKFAFNGVEKETNNEDFFFDVSCTLLAQMEEQKNCLNFKFKYKNRILDDDLVLNFSKIYRKLFADILNGLLNEHK